VEGINTNTNAPFTNLKKTIFESLNGWVQGINKVLNDVEKLENQDELIKALE